MNPPKRVHPHREPSPIASRWLPPLIAAALLHITTMAADHDSTSPPNSVWKSGTHRLTVDGRDRRFILDVPSKLQRDSPLVRVFHGFTSSTKEIRFVAAIAPVGGTMMLSWAKGFRPATRLSVLAVNARDDTTTLWDGDMDNRRNHLAFL